MMKRDLSLHAVLPHFPSFILVGLVALMGLLSLPITPWWKGFCFGFGVFTLDMALMIKIYAEMILVPRGESGVGKGTLVALALLKFLLIGGGLFAGIVVSRLSPAAIFWGALLSLLLCCLGMIALDRAKHVVAKK